MASNRKLFVELGVNSRKLGAGLRQSEKKFSNFGRKVSAGLKKSFAAVRLAAGVGAGVGFASIGKDVLDFEDALNRIEIQANLSAAETDSMRDTMLSLSNELGISRGEMVATGTALINLTGDAEFTKSSLETLAKANLATGASMEDLAGLALSLQKSFKLSGPDELSKGLSAIIAAGKNGAVPLGEMSAALQDLSADFTKLGGGTGVGGAADLAASIQVLRLSFKGANEAGTGMKAVFSGLKRNAKGFRKAGIRVFEKDKDGVKRFRDIRSILDDFEKSKLVKDPAKLLKLLGSVEAEKALNGLIDQREEFERLSDLGRGSDAVNEDSSKRQQSAAFKIQKSMNDAKEAFAKLFTPERIEKFVLAIEKLADLFIVVADNIKAAIAIGVASKFGPGAASLALSAGGALGGPGAKAALGAKGFGLVAAAGAAGYALGTFADNALGLSDGLSDFALKAFGPGDVARAAPSNRVESNKVNLAKALGGRGAAELIDLVGAQARAKSGSTFAQQKSAIEALGDPGQEMLRKLATQAVIAKAKGEDTSALIDKIASAIEGRPIHVTLAGESMKNVLDKAIGLRTSI